MPNRGVRFDPVKLRNIMQEKGYVIATLADAGITACMGHSNATFAEVEEAMRNGYSTVTHFAKFLGLSGS